jgi:putative ABC transport system substrate-binding protein
MNKTFWNRFLDSRSDNRKAKSGPADQNLKWLTLSVIGFVFVVAGAVAQAQQPAKIPRIGYLSGTGNAANPGPYVGALRQGLRDLGYVEGKNIVIVWRDEYGKPDRQRALAFELVRLKVAVIVTGGSTSTRVAKETTATIPIIMTQDPDPIGNGFVVSLARPGGNITGLSNLGPELSGKRLELPKEVLPRLTRVAVFGTSTFPGNAQILRETERAAGALRLQLQYLDVLDPKDIETVFRGASKARAEAVLVLAGPVFTSQRTQLAALAVKNRLPAIYYATEFVEDGGLMTYGANRADLARRAATYVDRILKGAKPADLPVEQPKKFEFIVNLKAAKQIGLTIPPNVLARADKVIK